MKIILPHKSTPSGVGSAVSTHGDVVLLTPCHGVAFYEGGQSNLNPSWSISAWCSREGCELEWTQWMFDSEAVLYFDCKVDDLPIHSDWLAKALGYNPKVFNVTVE